MGAMRALGIVLLLCAAACTKKPAPKAPAQPAPGTVERTAPPAPAATAKPGDPCSGGEHK